MLVVKLGGAAGNASESLLRELPRHQPVVLVHGGSEEIDRLGERLGERPRYFTAPSGTVSRYTDRAGLEVLTMALAGKVNTELVARLQALGVPAIGLSGVDGRLVVGRRKEGARAVENGRTIRVTNDFSATIERVDVRPLQLLLAGGYLPVVSPPAVTEEGVPVNIDADRMAAAIAVALHAEALVLLSNVPGLLRDPADPTSRVAQIPLADSPHALALAHGRMRKKVLAACEAVRQGVGRSVIASSRASTPLAAALAGQGTVFC